MSLRKKGGGDFSKVATFLTAVKSKDAAITCLICLPLISIVWMFENFYLNLPQNTKKPSRSVSRRKFKRRGKRSVIYRVEMLNIVVSVVMSGFC